MKQAGVYKMLDVVHLHEATVARRERRILADRVAKDSDGPLPTFRVELGDQVLPAKPAIVQIERDVGLTGEPHQPLSRQLHIHRSCDPPYDPLLRFEPVAETQAEAFAPHIDPGCIVPQHHYDIDFGTGLVSGGFDAVLRSRA